MLTYRLTDEELNAKRGRIRLLASDIDGTLLRTDHTLSDVVQEAVTELVKSGVQVILATGRRYSQAFDLARTMGLKTPLIAAGGATIKDPWSHETLFRAEFAPDLLHAALTAAMAGGWFPYLYTDQFPTGIDVLAPYGITEEMSEKYPAHCEYFARNAASIGVAPECFGLDSTGSREAESVDDSLRAIREGKIFTSFAVGSWDEMFALRDFLDSRFPQRFEMNVLRGPKYSGVFCEVLPAGIHKWSSIQRVARSLGIADDEVCAVGDDVNDLRMLCGAGIGVAMGNAAQNIMDEADMIAPPNTEDGITELLRWLAER